MLAFLVLAFSALVASNLVSACPVDALHYHGSYVSQPSEAPYDTIELLTTGGFAGSNECAKRCLFAGSRCVEAGIRGSSCFLFDRAIYTVNEKCDDDITSQEALTHPHRYEDGDLSAYYSITCIQCRCENDELARNAKCERTLYFQAGGPADRGYHENEVEIQVGTAKECAAACWNRRFGRRWWVHECLAAEFTPSQGGWPPTGRCVMHSTAPRGQCVRGRSTQTDVGRVDSEGVHIDCMYCA